VSFALLIPLVLYVIYHRVFVLRELRALDQAKLRAGVKGVAPHIEMPPNMRRERHVLASLHGIGDVCEGCSLGAAAAGYDWRSLRLLLTVFWHRMLGTAAIWFCNDWYFYGARHVGLQGACMPTCVLAQLCRHGAEYRTTSAACMHACMQQMQASMVMPQVGMCVVMCPAGNGVFRSRFISVLLGSKASVMNNWLWALLNAGIQVRHPEWSTLSIFTARTLKLTSVHSLNMLGKSLQAL
jgi:hypothetical protein